MFKASFKFYKNKSPAPSMAEVIDLDEPESEQLCRHRVASVDGPLPLPLGTIQPADTWRCYTLKAQHTGLIVVRGAFTALGQRYWITRCLRDFPRPPNAVNLNARQFEPAVTQDWWGALQSCGDKDLSRRMRSAMRWSTLGYHHNWDTKVYSETMRHVFPDDLQQMCSFFAQALGFKQFEAQAAIVNYYPLGTTLAGHTDHSERDLQAPLFSFSFGQSAVFLIGGKTLDEKPTALLLRSGDLLVMSRDSRLCYHAVPRVMKAHLEPWNELIPTQNKHLAAHSKTMSSQAELARDTACSYAAASHPIRLCEEIQSESFWKPFKDYLDHSRININVRQVLPAGTTELD